MKPTLYIETSIFSYLTARPSRDLLQAAWQELTIEFWESGVSEFDPCISPYLIEEMRRGDPEAAGRRLAAARTFRILPLNDEVFRLAEGYITDGILPEGAVADAAHLACATVHGIEFLLTWNCKHMANAQIWRRLREQSARQGFTLPVICTPDTLMGVDPDA